MDDPHLDIKEGDLVAYLEGERLPHVTKALLKSPALQERLQLLWKMNWQLRHLSRGVSSLNPLDLVDVAYGRATPQQQLRVAAYLRESASGRAEMAALLEEYARPKRGLPQFLALPLQWLLNQKIAGTETMDLAFGLRSSSTDTDTAGTGQIFHVSELHAQVVLRIVPLKSERWKLEGYITQQDQPVAGARVMLRVESRRPQSQSTDAGGFFTFTQLAPGVYRLQVFLAQGSLLIPPMVVGDDHD
jgi:hypothetical protein